MGCRRVYALLRKEGQAPPMCPSQTRNEVSMGQGSVLEIVSMWYFKISLACLASKLVNYLFSLEAETRHTDCSVLVRDYQEAAEAESVLLRDFITCSFSSKGDEE